MGYRDIALFPAFFEFMQAIKAGDKAILFAAYVSTGIAIGRVGRSGLHNIHSPLARKLY